MASLTFFTLMFTVIFAGCLTPPAPSGDDGTIPAPSPNNESGDVDASANEAEWHLSAQRSLGFYARAQVPFASHTRPNPDYCPSLFFTVPKGSTRLDLNFTSTPLNTSN